jgi:ABC-type hemin transport system substrate-binding protein
MPTSKPRYMLTDTGDLSELLDAAQRRWPEVADRKALLLLLAEAGGTAIAAEAAKQRTAIAETAGALTGLYEPGELERLREDWPE